MRADFPLAKGERARVIWKGERARVIWYDIYWKGTVEFTQSGRTFTVPLEFPTTTRKVIETLRASCVPWSRKSHDFRDQGTQDALVTART
jgi:hypothetical protein